jgi:hypothetical protein
MPETPALTSVAAAETERSEAPASAVPAEAAVPAAAIDVSQSESVESSPEPAPVSTSLVLAALEPEREPDATPPPVGDLDTRFFAESPAEAWLAHELERRDPQLLRKMTARVAQRRARLARYVVGVVGVAVVLCLAALVKSAVPTNDEVAGPRHASASVPAAQPAPLPLPSAAPDPPTVSTERADGGG